MQKSDIYPTNSLTSIFYRVYALDKLKPEKQCNQIKRGGVMEKQREEIKQHIIDYISDYIGTEGEELHHNMFNNDYYIIGTYQAKQWCGDDTFDIIEVIREYEQDNFGEVSTDFSDPEKVVNTYVYIVGEEILSEFYQALQGELTEEVSKEIIEELE